MRINSRTSLLPRTEYVRDAKLFVIAVEGRETEKQYFSLFNSSRVRIVILPAESDDKSAPRYVIERLADYEDQYNLGKDDERWLVWDVDHHRGQFLDEAAQFAQGSHYQLAISNPCFELWLRMHFTDADFSDINCQALKARLKKELGGYNWSNLNLSLYTRENITQAVMRAKALEGDRDTRWPQFPGTHVFKLVEKLLDFTVL